MKKAVFVRACLLAIVACISLTAFGCGRRVVEYERVTPIRPTEPTVPEGEYPSVYQSAVSHGYTGTAEELVKALAYEALGYDSAYKYAKAKGYVGTQSDWCSALLRETITNVPKGGTGYEMALEHGFSGTQEEWINSLITEEEGFSVKLNEVKPSFAIIDDDGKYKMQYLYEWALEHQVPVTSALITSYMDVKRGWLTTEKVLEMYQSGLITFASHTQNHVKLSEQYIDGVEEELTQSKADIEAMGIPCELMVYPFGAITEEGVEIVREHYRYGFLASGPVKNGLPYSDRVNFPEIDTYQLTRVSLRGDYTEENGGKAYIRKQIDDAIEKNGMLVFMTHVGSTSDGNGGYLDPELDLAMYTEALEYIRSKGYDLEPALTVCDRFQNIVEIIYE